MGGGTGALAAQVGAQLLADLAQRGDLGGAERVEYLWGSRTRPPVLTCASMRLARTH
jgi:hypothetical protein